MAALLANREQIAAVAGDPRRATEELVRFATPTHFIARISHEPGITNRLLRAFTSNPIETQNMAEAKNHLIRGLTLTDTTALVIGTVILLGIALGLAAYGVYSFARARYARV